MFQELWPRLLYLSKLWSRFDRSLTEIWSKIRLSNQNKLKPVSSMLVICQELQLWKQLRKHQSGGIFFYKKVTRELIKPSTYNIWKERFSKMFMGIIVSSTIGFGSINVVGDQVSQIMEFVNAIFCSTSVCVQKSQFEAKNI